MRTLLWGVLVLDQVFLLVVGATNLNRYRLSDFQLQELLKELSPSEAKRRRRLHKHLPKIRRQQQLELLLAFALGVTLFTQLISPSGLGLLWALASALAVAVLSRLEIIKKLAYRLFEYMLDIIITISTKMSPLWWLIGLPPKNNLKLPSSRQELADLLGRLPSATISPEEKDRLVSVSTMNSKTAKDILTPAKKVTTVSPSTTLSPILLSDLQKSKHGYFPVLDKKDGIIGMLSLKQVSDIGLAKHKSRVADIMSEELVWVPSDLPLGDVARMFLQAKQYVLLVQNEEFEFAGIITIADLLEHTLAISE